VTTRSDYTDEEWQNIKAGLLLSGMLVSTVASSGPIDTIREMLAISDVLADLIKHGSSNPLIAALIGELKPKEGESVRMRDTVPVNVKTTAELHRLIMETLQVANAALAKATADESAEYKQLVVKIAQRVAEAGTEGGFLGIGSVRVSPPELAAIQEIRTTLGMAN